MNRSVAAIGIACLEGTLALAQPAAKTPGPGAAASYRIVGQVVSVDAAARTVTVREVARRADPEGSGDRPGAGRATDSFTITLASGAASAAERHRPGDWVELTCGQETMATTAAPAPQATPGPAPTGTGALPGTGTTGVGTTGTGISGDRAPAPDSTPANAAVRDVSRPGAPAGSAADRFAGWVRTNCAVATAIAATERPPDPRP
jgi:hypothetical protein